MPAYDHSCLVSTVRNDSGSTKRFTFLPPHGKQLADGEEVSVIGNILEAVGRGDRGSGSRQRAALLAALDSGDLTLLQTPAPIIEDSHGDPVTLVVTGGSVAVAAPCWESEEGDWP